MEEKIESRAPLEKVWAGWAHMHAGEGKLGKFRYRVQDLVPKERFTLVWKAWCVRLFLTYAVYRTPRGSDVAFDVAVRGAFGWAVRWLLEPKIRKSLREALRVFVRQLER